MYNLLICFILLILICLLTNTTPIEWAGFLVVSKVNYKVRLIIGDRNKEELRANGYRRTDAEDPGDTAGNLDAKC